MSRTPLAILVGLIGFTVYLVGAATLADHLPTTNWIVQAVYFTVAGVLWVLPAKWLMVWAAKK